MPQFAYRIAKGDGTILEDRTEAENEVTLRQQLEGKGYLVFSIRKAAGFSLPQIRFDFKSKLTPREFLAFNQEFLALIKAGLPIIRALDILVDRVELASFRDALRGIRQEIKGGSSIADAMSKYPQQFPELYVSFRSGQVNGAGTLPRLSNAIISIRNRNDCGLEKGAIRADLSDLLARGFGCHRCFPPGLCHANSSLEIYRESDAQIPVPTRVLLHIVQLLRGNFLWIILALGAGAFFLRLWSRTASGRVSLQRFYLRLPLLGDIMLKSYLIQITRTLSAILSGGIPLVTALGMVADAITNQAVSKKVYEMRERVKEGISLASAFERTGFMPRLTVEMVGVGEATGALEQLLTNAAEFHEEELDILLARVTTWVEPLLLLFMGTMVATIVIIGMYSCRSFNLAGTIR